MCMYMMRMMTKFSLLFVPSLSKIGTGKTRIAALTISTALKMKLKDQSQSLAEEEDTTLDDVESKVRSSAPRVLAVTHSNGAADVLLQALLDMGVPAVRGGRPASVSPSIQHRTIAALAERMPEAQKLRQQASDATLDKEIRQAAIYDSKKYVSEAQEMIARSAPVVVTSCIGAQQLLSSIGENEKKDASTFPIVVLDEAGQTTEPALVCALSAAKAKQVILVGDTQQLPPTVTTQDVELRKTIGVSPMERLLNNGIDEFVLKEQYRMPQSLLYHPNQYVYSGVVKCAATTDPNNLPSAPPLGFPWPSPKNDPLAFLDAGNDSEVAHNFGSRTNPTEVKVILDIVEKIILAGDVLAKNIAIITPYSKQVQLIRNELANASQNTSSKMSEVQVGTVDSYQGQEVDLVLFSAVRSNLLKELGFLRDSRRLNVAITRAKRGLIIVGDSKVLRSCRHWNALLEHCHDEGCVLTHDEYRAHGLRLSANANVVVSDDDDLSMLDLESLFDLESGDDDEFYGLFS